jgi:polysaccharide chain length determinant protein (PEP-CTERM system associated)
MIGHRELEFGDYLSIVRRRLWLILIPALIVPVLAYTVSLKLPNRYTSQTLVLVEQQKVPDNFVKPVVAEDWNQRLITMQEQILSRSRLEPIILKYDLYHQELGKATMEDVLERMRKAILVNPLKGDSGGVPGFYISFTASDPKIAQKVCGEITSIFMDENVKARQQSAQGTTDFLSSQLEEAKRTLDSQDAALAAFKSKYLNQLPGRDSTNLAMLTSLNAQIDALTQTMTQAEQQKTYLQSMLAQQLATWKNRQGEGSADPDSLEKRRAVLQSELLNLQARYTPDHPDVIKAKAALSQIDQKIADGNSQAPETKVSTKKSTANEPTEIAQLRLSIRQVDDTIKNKLKEQERVQGDIRTYQARIQLSPMVEEEFKKLTRDYQTAQTFYDDLLGKRRQSEMATELERRQQGEQFRVMDPPNLPQRPTFPNRLMITLGGLAAGLVLGAGSAAVLELRDQSLRTEQDVMASLKLPILGSIPALGEEVPKREKRTSNKSLVGV